MNRKKNLSLRDIKKPKTPAETVPPDLQRRSLPTKITKPKTTLPSTPIQTGKKEIIGSPQKKMDDIILTPLNEEGTSSVELLHAHPEQYILNMESEGKYLKQHILILLWRGVSEYV